MVQINVKHGPGRIGERDTFPREPAVPAVAQPYDAEFNIHASLQENQAAEGAAA